MSWSGLSKSQLDLFKVDRAIHSTRRRLIVLTGGPEVGRVMTRLMPVLGAERAATLQEVLYRCTLQHAHAHAARSAVEVEVRLIDGTQTFIETSSSELKAIWREQQSADLGRRMQRAIEVAFAEGCCQVVVIGTACPEVSPNVLDAAWLALERHDVVLGPTTDGGCYLVSVNQPDWLQLLEIDWGTEHVLRQILERCQAMRLTVGQLTPLTAINNAEDLIGCRRRGVGFEDCLPETQPDVVSIVVPTLNEVTQLEATVGDLVRDPRIEVLVADGGSSDGTVELAKELGCRVVQAQRGRGRQMNAGAAMARGELLLFLHADTRLPHTWNEELRAILSGGAIAGAFRLRIEQVGWALRCVEWGAHLRSRWRQMPYGDQGLFLRSSDFFRLGGFRHWPLMEDYEFSQRLRRHGRIALALSAVRTSARRWQSLGVVRATVINQLCIIGYRLGISPASLVEWYLVMQHPHANRQQQVRPWQWWMIGLVGIVLLAMAGVIFGWNDRPNSRTREHDRQTLARMMAENRRAFPEATEVSIEEVIELVRENRCVLVDVRTEAERNVSLIPGAISAADFERAIDTFSEKAVVCYCTIGYRSAKYAQEMQRQNVAVASFNGSIVAWCQAGQKLTTPDGRETNRVHVYGPKWDLIPPNYVSER